MQVTHSQSRRRHSAQFKQEVLAACDQPGASVAGVALAHGLNANLVRQWRRGRGCSPASGEQAMVPAVVQAKPTAQSAPPFVALALPATRQSQATPATAVADIRIKVRRGALDVSVIWPTSAGADCANWLRELLT